MAIISDGALVKTLNCDPLKNDTSLDWRSLVRPYSFPDAKRSWWQVANTLVPLFTLLYASYKCLALSPLLSIAISCLNLIFFMRAFILLHDCGHGSLFREKWIRTSLGTLCGILTFTPYKQWSREHAGHHAKSGNLDKRGLGDMWTLTTEEYSRMSATQKLGYHLYRFPPITFILGPFYLFQLRFRFRQRFDGAEEDRNRYLTNAILFLLISALCLHFGWKAFLIVHLPIILLFNTVSTLMFFVQHQYEDAYWKPDNEWNYFEASMKGSSYLKLPKFFQWATGNIGLHHIHHLSHQIPNYKLQAAYDENELFHRCKEITFFKGLKGMRLKLWDPKSQEMISFREYYSRYGSTASDWLTKNYQRAFPWLRPSNVAEG